MCVEPNEMLARDGGEAGVHHNSSQVSLADICYDELAMPSGNSGTAVPRKSSFSGNAVHPHPPSPLVKPKSRFHGSSGGGGAAAAASSAASSGGPVRWVVNGEE